MSQQRFPPEGIYCLIGMCTLVATVTMHTGRVDHELKLLAGLLQSINKLDGVLEVDIIVARAVSQV